MHAHKHTHTSRGASFIALLGVLHDTHTHTSSCVLEICLMMTHTYTHPYPRLIALHNSFLFHVYRSVSLACMWRYTQLAYLFHQCAMSLFSRDSHIADCTVRHPGVKHLFSSLNCFWDFQCILYCTYESWLLCRLTTNCSCAKYRDLATSSLLILFSWLFFLRILYYLKLKWRRCLNLVLISYMFAR